MIKAKPILPIWQPQGASTHVIAKIVSDLLGVKTSHTGTLDPMASGVIIVLTGEERLKKYEYAGWLKTYTFEILFGVTTDTYDGMGLITKHTTNIEITSSGLSEVLESLIGDYSQKVPAYAAIKVKGKPLHHWARNNVHIEQPRRHGTIHKLELIDLKMQKEKKTEIINQIKNVAGDFRQEEIIKAWETTDISDFLVAKCQVTMSKGLYVRQLVQDICNKLQTLGIAHNICRIQNGTYTQKDCINATELDFV